MSATTASQGTPQIRPAPSPVVRLMGMSVTSMPLVINSAAPRDIPRVPKVTMRAGTFATATRKPFRRPHANPASSETSRPSSSVPMPPRPTAPKVLAAMTPENTSTPLMDRSIPAVRIT